MSAGVIRQKKIVPCFTFWVLAPLGLAVPAAFLGVFLFGAFRAQTELSLPLQLLLAAAFLIALCALYYSLKKARFIAASLLDTEDAIRAFTRGYFTRTLPETVPLELSSLSSAVNALGTRLDRQIQDLVKRCEQQRSTLANMQEGLLVLDMDHRILSVNNAAARFLNTEVETLQGRDVRSFGEIGEALARAPGSGEEIELSIPGRTGERWLRARVTLLRDVEKRPLGNIIELTEITDIKRFTQTRQDFVANVSHELKTPITSIQGYVETLLDGETHSAENRDRFLRIVAEQADRLSSIVSELLSLARLESEQHLDPDTLCEASIPDLLSSVCDACEVAARRRNIAIDLDCEKELRWKLNRWLVEQAVINLVDNSIKYGNSDTTIRVIARLESRRLVISVLDESAGIAPEHLPRLFERFYRVDKARTRKAGGSGLGLAIVKHIAAVHGGKILAESDLGRGSNFSLIIPLL